MSRYFLKYFTAILLFITYISPSIAAVSDIKKDDYSSIELVSSYHQNQNNKQELLIAFHFKLKKGWKIYGNSDSSFANPPEFDFTDSKNIDINKFEILWPEPKIMIEDILGDKIQYPIYENEFSIPIKINVLDLNETVNINAIIDYALCKDICIPASHNIQLQINPDDYDQKSLGIINLSIKSEDFSLSEEASQLKNNKITLISAIILAFFGGLILNFMPCVLPVISIKLISILEHAKSSVKKIRIAYLSTILGIVFSFTALALLTCILRYFGNEIGWGIQFQNPYFLIFLTIILTIFIANLIGLFEIHIGSFLSNLINKKVHKNKEKEDLLHIIFTNFLSGILVVILATPCSAPLIGSAISFAFTQDSFTIFTIFIFMSLGLSLPYFILIAFPKSIKILPKPGDWMNNLKILMAIFLFMTIIWLIFILSNNIGLFSSAVIAFLLIFTIISLFICNKFEIRGLRKKIFIILLSIITLYSPILTGKYSKIPTSLNDLLWVKFNQEKIVNYVNEGKIVIIDITADWCISCKANKRLVLDSKEIIALLNKDNIIGMRGNITKPNKIISNFMKSHNIYAIPFNIVYGPGAKNGIKTSELLSKTNLIKAIKTAQ